MAHEPAVINSKQFEHSIQSDLFHTKLQSGGRIVIPSACRKRLGLKPGDDMVLEVKGDTLYLTSAKKAIAEEPYAFSPRMEASRVVVSYTEDAELARIPAIGLFSGAGGLEIGASWAGADVRLSVEIDPIACQTLRLNPTIHAGTILEADVTRLRGGELRRLAGLTRRDTCIVIGGPPCQPFSKSAYWTDPGDESQYRRARARGESVPKPAPITEAKPDERRSLLEHYWRLIEEIRADAFLFENVLSITHPRHRKAFEQLVRAAEAGGYRLRLLRVNALEYGVPQRRNRVVLLGVRGKTPDAPQPTHAQPGAGSLVALPFVSAAAALRPYQDARYFEPEEVVTGRYAKELQEIPPGHNYKALTAWAGHPNPVFEAETRFWNFLLKLSPDLPSWTVQATPGPWVGPFHWESRRLRIVELAALQGFPAGYVFAGNRRDRIRQIGNAVPPLLAQRMIEPLIEALTTERRTSARRAPVEVS